MPQVQNFNQMLNSKEVSKIMISTNFLDHTEPIFQKIKILNFRLVDSRIRHQFVNNALSELFILNSTRPNYGIINAELFITLISKC